MRQERGFTLIELVVVIVILGILAATALPKYIDLTSDANASAVDSVAGALSSASATNYAARKANTALGVTVASCTDVENAMQTFPSGYTVTGSTAISVDSAVTCTVTNGKATSTFTAIGS